MHEVPVFPVAVEVLQIEIEDIGGLDVQKQEVREAVELPLTHPELYEDIGIKPPKGVFESNTWPDDNPKNIPTHDEWWSQLARGCCVNCGTDCGNTKDELCSVSRRVDTF